MRKLDLFKKSISYLEGSGALIHVGNMYTRSELFTQVEYRVQFLAAHSLNIKTGWWYILGEIHDS